ncbi:OsmC family protein [Lutispora sp.]|uniref:OsmC family protein n=1 Tax=Lutispora sp. TaxID=2828727 RepID=UPI002B1FDB13|nr:OsmC family protein [Lutispora sp.]MEA4960392.1 OsmC family protein [Lutispora sp.]
MPKITFKVKSTSETPMKSVVETGHFKMIIDEPKNLGGTNDGASPVEYLLAALAGCLNIVGHAVAKEIGMKLNGLQINVEGDLDPAKFMGKPSEARTGYQEVRVSLKPDTDADQATLDQWLALLEDRCPVSDNLAHMTPLKIAFMETEKDL